MTWTAFSHTSKPENFSVKIWLGADVKWKCCLNWVPQLKKIQRLSSYSRNKKLYALMKFAWRNNEVWSLTTFFTWVKLSESSPRVYSASWVCREILQCAEQSHEDSYSSNRHAYYKIITLYLQSTIVQAVKNCSCV